MFQRILEIPGETVRPKRLQLLHGISPFPWFTHEFADADGFTFLNIEMKLIPGDARWLNICIDAMYSATTHSHLMEWLLCLRNHLDKPPKRPTFDRTTPRLKTIYESQKRQRSSISSYLAPDTTAITLPLNIMSRRASEINTSPWQQIDRWSRLEWKEYCSLMEEVTTGLRRGYIGNHSTRYISDPDDICFS